VRITAQLIDAANGAHQWADRYDRDLTDIFAVQDEITRQIVSFPATLSPAAEALLAGGVPTSVDTHDFFLRGRELLFGAVKNRETFDRANEYFWKAIGCDPSYAEPYAGLAVEHIFDNQNQWTANSERSLEAAEQYAAQAIERNPNEPLALWAVSLVALWKKDLERAKIEAQKLVDLNPNFALGCVALSTVHIYSGEPHAAIPLIERGMRLDPAYSQQFLHFLSAHYCRQI
jgi:adenylate cyclase